MPTPFSAQSAIEVLQSLHDYIALDLPFYASHFIDRMTRFTEQLIIHPEISRQLSEAGLGDICEIIFQLSTGRGRALA